MRNTAMAVGAFLLSLSPLLTAGQLTKEQAEPFRNARQYDLSGLMSISTGDLGGRRIKELISKEKTIRVIILANNTQAPAEVHLRSIGLLIDKNPAIDSMWIKDEKAGGNQWNSAYDNIPLYFAVLLEDDHGDFIGLIYTREFLRIVTKQGIGVIKKQ